jgi:cysteinyl-tRNA synthetase
MIYLKNTLSGIVEEFKPIDSKKIGMYNCGPTVYGKVHVGNMRAYIFADLIKNILIYNGYPVHQVINITDVGHLVSDNDEGADKVEEQAKKEHIDATVITQKYTEYFMEKLKELNIDSSTIDFPKASDNISEQINLIKVLEEKGFTYTTSDGVYFDTAKFPAYGELGHIDIKGLQEGARVESNSEKRNATDFALWKFSKEARQQEWESPWGVGFPGWHIECSAMASKYLGDTFDIHTGGIDHIPTHHQNEIAQSVCAHDAPLANYWLHVNHITIDGKKISKSKGNTVFIEDLIEKNISPIAYKYWIYTSHYSTLSNFTFESVQASQVALQKLYSFIEKTDKGNINTNYKEKFTSLINNDLDTAKGIALLWELLKDTTVSDEDKKATIINFDEVFKFGLSEIKKKTFIVSQEVSELAEKRKVARLNRDFALADALREEIERQGFVLKDVDTEIGYTIEKK